MLSAEGPMNLNFNEAENEKLTTQFAAVRTAESSLGSGVVLNPSGQTLCSCPDEADAHLIKKLFNLGLRIPNP